ncbi:hypothetical protein TEA_027226 [Camellia sinensis var. sinensis]|uniref:Purple acid phosphatase n=1 Tax=Camellia sinensis var. sinensis TaxID=542762 RepID=A0A4S4DW71_CAMSN|nr:hypothetical protein TEA_027226 [Camellia sinensis var. sinensis]
MGFLGFSCCSAIAILGLLLNAVVFCKGGTTSAFVRPVEKSVDMPLDSDVFLPPRGYNAPQQFDTKYYYEVGIGRTARTFWFTTPPEVGPDVPYTFGLIDYDSNKTLTHYESNPTKWKTVLFVGDLSYADYYPNHGNERWDTWGRFVERSTAYQPWIWTAGNHEIDFAPELGETKPFKPFTHRYRVPYKASNSVAPFWYSIKRASAYIIVLSSYSAYGKYTPQYQWLLAELPKVNRSETPWLIVLMHVPWYNSYNDHYMEGETMRVMFEPWFVQHKVDVVFAGHLHAYERSERVSNIAYNVVNGICSPVKDQSAPVYITIGDGGNIGGLATNMTEPQPKYSAFREASFGHAIFDIKNRTQAYYSWHRNQDGNAVEADSLWFFNRIWHSVHPPPYNSHLRHRPRPPARGPRRAGRTTCPCERRWYRLPLGVTAMPQVTLQIGQHRDALVVASIARVHLGAVAPLDVILNANRRLLWPELNMQFVPITTYKRTRKPRLPPIARLLHLRLRLPVTEPQTKVKTVIHVQELDPEENGQVYAIWCILLLHS